MDVLFLAVIKLVAVIFFGFYLYKRTIINNAILTILTACVINVTVPCLIFSNIVSSFSPDSTPSVWLFLGLSIALFLLGLVVGILFSRSVPQPLKREFISLISFQNCGYLPMSITVFLLAPDVQETFLTYIFLYILGFNILMWSVASFFIFKQKNERFRLRSVVTPPTVSIVVSLAIVYGGFAGRIPNGVMLPLYVIGRMSFLLSMIVLGGWFARSKAGMKQSYSLLSKVSILKLIIVPMIVFVCIVKWHLSSLLGLFLLLEASMPSAASLPIVADMRRANSEFVSQGVFVTHLAGMFTIPLWIGIFAKLFHNNFML